MAILEFDRIKDRPEELDNLFYFDEYLSFRSKGILSLLYELFEDEIREFHLQDIADFSRDEPGAIRSSFREMETRGYISRKMLRDEHGKFKALLYTVHPVPKMTEPAIVFLQYAYQPEEESCDPGRKKSQNDRTFSQTDGKKSQSEQNFPSERTDKRVRAKSANPDWWRVAEIRK